VSLTLVDLFAPNPGLLHHGLVDLLHPNGEDVAVEDDKAGLEALGDLVRDVLVGSQFDRPSSCRASRPEIR
jgi:hypothetical protein